MPVLTLQAAGQSLQAAGTTLVLNTDLVLQPWGGAPPVVTEPAPWLQYSAATDSGNNLAAGTTLYQITGSAGPPLNAEANGMSLSTDAALGNIPVPAALGAVSYLRATQPTPSTLLGSTARWLDILVKVSTGTTELFGYGSRNPNGCFDLVYDAPASTVGMNFGGNSNRFATLPMPTNTYRLIQVDLASNGSLRATNGTTTATAAALDIGMLSTGTDAGTLDNLRVALGLTGSLYDPPKYIAYVALGAGERTVAQTAAARDRILAQFNNLFS